MSDIGMEHLRNSACVPHLRSPGPESWVEAEELVSSLVPWGFMMLCEVGVDTVVSDIGLIGDSLVLFSAYPCFVSVCMHVCLSLYSCMCVCIYVSVYLWVSVSVCMLMCKHVYVCMCV